MPERREGRFDRARREAELFGDGEVGSGVNQPPGDVPLGVGEALPQGGGRLPVDPAEALLFDLTAAAVPLDPFKRGFHQ